MSIDRADSPRGPMHDVPLIIVCSMGTDGFKEAVSADVSESLLREEIDGKRRALHGDGRTEAVAEAIHHLLGQPTVADR